jgi:Arc/MetJ-type ribon-helix-helix transcriptional regulator
MPLSVRIPHRVEQELDEYCVKHRVSRSEAVKQALDEFLAAKAGDRSPYELVREFIAPDTDEQPTEDVARNTRRLLRERFRGKGK